MPLLPIRAAAYVLLRSEALYSGYLRAKGAYGPHDYPDAGPDAAVLRTAGEAAAATARLLELGLPLHPDPPKNWDNLLALQAILFSTIPSARVVDAGGTLYSAILPALYLYGYRDLHCLNLAFPRPYRRGPIRFDHGDITATGYPNESVDVVTCLSVIEHGVDPEAFFRECRRILKPGGMVLLSTDYWHEPMPVHNATAYGSKVHIFDPQGIRELVATAERQGLQSLAEPALGCAERVVRWERVDLDYTFIFLSFRKTDYDIRTR